MTSLFGIGFTAPWLLLGLLALPILWILLRAVPPAPVRRAFPGVALLLGLRDDEAETDRTPWWLLLLRMLAAAALILGFAGPVLNPPGQATGGGPLLILADASWASAPDWAARRDRIAAELDMAGAAGRPVALVRLTDPPPPGTAPAFSAAADWAERLAGLAPAPWEPGEAAEEWAAGLTGSFDTLWISDGLDRPRGALIAALRARGDLRIVQSGAPVLALGPARFADQGLALEVLRTPGAPEGRVEVVAIGPDPAGAQRVLERRPVALPAGATRTELRIEAPPELRNRFRRFAIEGRRSAGAVSLADDALKRREVALYSGTDIREGLQLLSPGHYLRQALAPSADLIDGALQDVLLANPDVIILADVARLSPAEAQGLEEWVRGGGLLVRFAGPRMAAADLAREGADPLLPVRLRAGGRRIGGAMSWGNPRAMRPFAEDSPFYGLEIPAEVTVSAQVLAQPGPELADRTIAALDDGTPLVTRAALGEGQVVLFHVTANAEWSTLPLSGLFVQMLERLAISTRPALPEAAELAGTIWTPVQILDGFGTLREAPERAAVPGEALAEPRLGPDLPPGLYAGPDRQVALNVIAADRELGLARWPAGLAVGALEIARPRPLGGWLLLAALAALALDILASLALSGRLRGPRGRGAMPAAMLLAGLLGLAALLPAGPAQAQDAETEFALAATSHTVLAYVLTGNAEVDAVSKAGLTGLSDVLFARTSVEPADPLGVDLERDELAFFPLLYWPVTPDQALPSDAAYARLNRYLRNGGMIVFDTRDADVAGLGAQTANGVKLQALALPLDIPPLEPVPADHILTRTFYLLQDFPGRHVSRDVWVEAAPADAVQAEGMPFRNLNDNVTPVVIGGNDWAAAWAVDAAGNWMFPVGRGSAGARQRELALRFGVNLVMHVLTGNYKSDQVHVPALLDRLGQ